jgi:SAM dependent carboxyl methyltransferase
MNETTAGELPVSANLGIMEGHGAYNQHARLQASGGSVALPLLEQAARMVDPSPDDRPLVIADYGSSQGRNSLRPMAVAIAVFQERFGRERPICVVHTDLPDNDFGALFHTLHIDPDSYLRDQPNIFPSAVGRSFFESVVPPAQVALGWCSFAAQWLSRVPAYIPGHFHELRAASAVREAFHAQAAADWRRFLSLRARELSPTGRLVILLPTGDEVAPHGIEPLFDAANDSIAELVDRGVISAAERARMVVPDRVRSRIELLAPFAETGSFADLTVEHCDVLRGPDGMWAAYREHGDARRLATERAQFFRVTFTPTLSAALDTIRPPADRRAFAEEMETAMVRRLETEPFEIPQALAIMVVARQAA